MINIKNVFSKISNFKQKENINFKKWNEIFLKTKYKKRKEYIIHDGPPYANGDLHMGHILNKTIKDTIIRKKIIQGYKVSYLPGWDCHGIPIELNVLKNSKKHDFLKYRIYANNQIKNHIKVFKKMGYMFGFKNYYKTMSFDIEYKTCKFFIKLLKKKKIIIKKKILNFCSICNTTISNFEILKKKKNISYNINILEIKKIKFIFFTKKNKKIKKIITNKYKNFYLFKKKKNFYILLEDQIKYVKENPIKKISNNYFKKIFIFYNKKFTDFIYKKKFYYKKIFNNNTYINVCDRHKNPTEKLFKKEFFIKIEKSKIKKNLKIIKFFPKIGYINMINNFKKFKEWNISRQKNWGTPIALFFSKKYKKIFYSLKILKNIKKKGIEFWNRIKKKNKIKDILDVWFDSGVTHNTVLNNKKCDVIIEGIDQFRGWFNCSFITSYINNKNINFKSLVFHGFIVDENGLKMSKSLGNYIKPELLIKKYSSEIIRFFLLSKNYFKNIKISETKIVYIKKEYIKIRNSIRFMVNNTYDYSYCKKNLLEIDKFVINELIKNIKNCFLRDENFEFFKSIKIIKKFIKFLSNFYFETIKERLYLYKKNSFFRRTCQKTIFFVLRNILLILCPYLPSTCEYAWDFYSKKSIFTEKFNKIKKINTKINEKNWFKLIKLKKKINKIFNLRREKYKIFFYGKFKFLKKLPKYFVLRFLKFNNFKIIKSLKEKITFLKVKKKKCKLCWNYFKKKCKVCL
ncbi:class I tRNA ligase family protein [Candidatus Vidania fulgoroideorum]